MAAGPTPERLELANLHPQGWEIALRATLQRHRNQDAANGQDDGRDRYRNEALRYGTPIGGLIRGQVGGVLLQTVSRLAIPLCVPCPRLGRDLGDLRLLAIP